MLPTDAITTVVINYRTADLTRRCVDSFLAACPDHRLLLIDNGSHDESTELLTRYGADHPSRVELLLNPVNRHHGPAMDQALRHVSARYLLFLDSDCEVLRSGFAEEMADRLMREPRGYAIGKRIFMNDRGFDVEEHPGAHPYIRPICMLIDRAVYLTLPPFERHGAPCLRNMIAASREGWALLPFPVERCVRHEGRGTAARHGYALGLRGRLNHLLNRLGL